MKNELASPESLEAAISALSDWLNNKALPTWISAGIDESVGGFHERIGQDGRPMTQDNRRARVQPRQIYCFSAAGTRGFNGPWEVAVRNGLSYFEQVFRRPDGLFGAVANPAGALIDDTFDLYNQAFALFAYAQIAKTFPDALQRMEELANELLAVLKEHYKHPLAGFEEANPQKLPLCSNPHMHLFEACLAWEEIAKEPAVWRTLADEIAHLAMEHFIDSQSGGLREFFDHDWKPHGSDKGRVMEPGHQFEWAWLLARWGASRNHAEAILKAERLFDIGLRYGLSTDGKVAIMSLNDDFSVRDDIARMWPQTEWLKAATKLAVITHEDRRAFYISAAIKACKAFEVFLDTPVSGLWYDKRRPDGTLVDEPAPASTFYHILCAIYEAEDNLKALEART